MNRLDTVPVLLNDTLHRLFLGSMVLVIFLFYQYISILVEEETGKPRRLDLPAKVFLVLALMGIFLLPISYTATQEGNYSSGQCMLVPYAAVAFYLLLCAGLLTANWTRLDGKKKFAISEMSIRPAAEQIVCGGPSVRVLQTLNLQKKSGQLKIICCIITKKGMVVV